MNDPFSILGVPDTATDEQVRKAYLARVRQHPPEQSPQQFRAIRTAFEAIRTRKARLAWQLFQIQAPDLDSVCRELTHGAAPGRPTERQLKEMLSESLRTVSGNESIPWTKASEKP